LIDSEGYVFCQKLTAEGTKRILAASQCIQKLSTNVLVRPKELAVKGLLTLNKVQHEPILGKLPDPDFVIRHAALGVNIANLAVDHTFVPVLSAVLEGTSKVFEAKAKKNKDLEAGAILEDSCARLAEVSEVTLLWLANPHLAILVSVAKLAGPVLDKLDSFALEHGQDWKTKTGGVYAR